MKRFFLPAFLAAAIVSLAIGCGKDRLSSPVESTTDDALDPNGISYELVSAAGWTVDPDGEAPARSTAPPSPGGLGAIVGFERQTVAPGIVHYAWRIKTGRGLYDAIGLHRVVRESAPYRPRRTDLNFFFQHGCCKNFVGMMLPGLTSPATADDFGMAVYLARHGVDVWGIDQAWTLVPEGIPDVSFMVDWGIARQSRDLRLAVTMARAVRMITGCGAAKMILAGYSNGVFSSIAVVNEETQVPPRLRQVGGYVPIDAPIKAIEPTLLANLNAYIDGYYIPLYESGVYAETGVFAPMAALVRCCPDDDSPFMPGVTNLQYALLSSCSPILGASPDYAFHYWAPVLDESGMPTALRYTDREMWLDFLASGLPWEPMIWGLEWVSYSADRLDTPFDDHLGEIRVPILNVTPAGGFGATTEYGISLLGSADKQTLMPATGLTLAEEYAHIDIFTYPASEQLVWEPLLQWLAAHSATGVAVGD